MSKFSTTENLVLKVLEECKEARQDDYILMLKVCGELNPSVLRRPFFEVMSNHRKELPNWETVTRCRRKIQEKRPDLAVSTILRKRREQVQDYVDYARHG